MNPLILPAIFFFGFGGMLLLGFLYERKRASARRAAVLALGFAPLSRPDPALRRGVSALYRPRRCRLQNVFRRQVEGGDLYLFDVLHSGTEVRRFLAYGAMALVSPALQLPRFSIYPKLLARGVAGAALGALESALLPPEETRVAFGAFPDFEAHYWVTGQDVAAVQQALSPALLDRLAATRDLVIQGQGDILTVARRDMPFRDSHAIQQQLPSYVHLAAEVFGWFRGG